jgi:hypothetical protein
VVLPLKKACTIQAQAKINDIYIVCFSICPRNNLSCDRLSDFTVMAVATDFHRTFLTPLARISATDILLYYFYCITEKLFVKTDKKTNGVCGTDSPNFYPLYNPKLIFYPLRYA